MKEFPGRLVPAHDITLLYNCCAESAFYRKWRKKISALCSPSQVSKICCCSVSLTMLIVYTISTVNVLDYYKGKGNN